MASSAPARRWLWHGWPVLAVVLAGSLGSFLLWQQQQQAMQALAQQRFVQESGVFARTLQRRMASYTDMLFGLRNLMVLHPGLTRADFERAASQLDLPGTHPEVRNVHFTRQVLGHERADFERRTRSQAHLDGQLPTTFAIHPGEERPRYYVVEYFWPLPGNEGLLGLENHSQPGNLEALERARSSAAPVASAPFALAQAHTERTGVIIRLPVFAHAGSGNERRFLGTVGVTLRVHDVIEQLRSEGRLQGLGLSLRDTGVLPGSAQADAGVSGVPGIAMLEDAAAQPWYAGVRDEQPIRVGGRAWQLTLWPTQSFLSPTEARQPVLLASGALVATLLAGVVAALLVWRRQQALTRAQRADQALVESEERFRALFHQASVGMVQVCAATGALVRVNAKYCAIVGYSAEALAQMRYQDLTVEEDLPQNLALVARMRAGELDEFQMEKRYRHRDGHLVWVHLTTSVLRMAEGDAQFFLAVVQDVSERKRLEAERAEQAVQLRESEQRLHDILNHMPVGVSLVEDGRFVYRNQRHLQISGYSAEEMPGVDDWWRLLVPDAAQRAAVRAQWHKASAAARAAGEGVIAPQELIITSKTGFQRNVLLAGVARGTGYVVTVVDQTRHKQAEEEIQYLVYTDPLTGLPNRRLLLDRMQQAISRGQRQQRCVAVLMLDLDHFKTINETRGYESGDALLREVAQRLRESVPPEATLARHGGDEFTVCWGDMESDPQEAAAHAEELGRRLLQTLQAPLALGEGAVHHGSFSIGVALFHGEGVGVDELLKRSEIAMYEAKAAGRNTLRFYDPQMQAAVSARVQLEGDMRAGLEQGQFELFYQPKVHEGRIFGAEALLRWRHPERGFVSPGVFIPLAEDCGLILPLGQWVLETACAQLARWGERPQTAHLSIAVNVSPRQFHEADFVPQVLAAVAASGANARRLKLELTEGMLLHNVEETIAKMVQLRSYGVGFSLDDFGTGYSSLAYLKRLPLQELKIDQSFVRDVLSDPNDAAIARTIVALGTSLGLRVVAEGVETERQRDYLARIGCHTWQGYLLSPPVPVAQFEALLPAPAAPAEPAADREGDDPLF